MSEPISPPSLASLPTQLLTSAPAWYWRYASVLAISFLMVVGGDYYLGSPVAGWLRAVAAQRVKAVETRPALPDPEMTAKIDALVTAIDKISSMQASMALKEREFKALSATLEFTIGRVGTLEAAMAKEPAPPRKVKTVAVKPEPPKPDEPVAPMVQIGGAP